MSDQKQHKAVGPGNLSSLLFGDRSAVMASVAAWPRARLYLVAFVAAFIACIVSFLSALALLSATNRLPAPPVSGTWCIDEKLAWLRNHPGSLDANLIAVGSSVTWRNLDFSVLSPATRSAVGGVVNAAPCVLRVNQTGFMINYLLQRRPEIHTVVTVLSPLDMEACSMTPAAFFDPKLADAFLERTVSDSWIYFRNLRPRHFVEDVIKLPERRVDLDLADRFGSLPMPNRTPELWYPLRPDPRCFRDLRNLASELRHKNVQLVVVTFPVMPAWAERHDTHGSTQETFNAGVRTALADTAAILVDAQNEYALPTSAFTDPAHLHWPEATRFTRYVWERARESGAKLPPSDSAKHD